MNRAALLPRLLVATLATSLGVASTGSSIGCNRSERAESTATGATSTSAATPLTANTDPKNAFPSGTAPVLLDFLAAGPTCTFGHRGTLLDLGDVTMRSRMSSGKPGAGENEVREREGASWLGVHNRSLELTFVSPVEEKAESGVVVEARMRGGLAKSASVYLNGKPLGILGLSKGEAKIVSAHAPAAGIARGENTLLLRFNGGARTVHDELAEIDWIRVGSADGDAPYSAPTRNDAVATVAVGGVGKRSLSLRAPGFARCSGYVPSGAVLETQLGVTGGEADAEVRVLVDRAEPRVVGTFHVGGQDAPVWRPIALPLGDVGTIAAVELVAKNSTKGARVLFGEPKVTTPSSSDTAKPVKSRGVVLVVLGSEPPRMLSPYGGTLETPELAALAASGMIFEAHRAPTSFASGSVASMLTGLGSREHGVTDPDAALGSGGLTVAEAARQAGIVTAMFTANPTTSTPYGFARGWETFVFKRPDEDVSATMVFDEAIKWLDLHKDERFLLVVHARGGHPPWEIASEDLKELPPNGYAGALDPKHAGEMLAKAKRATGMRLFTDADRERAFALHAKAVVAHDAALGKLVGHLKALGRDADTGFIVTGDVGIDPAAHVPFLEDEALDEATLSLPLVVTMPGATPNTRIAAPTTSADIGKTILEALGLPPPVQMRGESLWAIAKRGAQADVRPLLATTVSRFSARWGSFVLVGAQNRDGKLCNLSLEADCIGDVRATHPLAAEVMHDLVVTELDRGTIGPPQPVIGKANAARAGLPAPARASGIDTAATTSLKAWGR